MHIDRVKELFNSYYSKSISEGEKLELFQLISEMNENDLENILNQIYSTNSDIETDDYSINTISLWKELSASLQLNSTSRTGIYRNWIKVSTIAAILISIFGFALYQIFYKTDSDNQFQFVKVHQDIPPGSNKAILTLANGDKVFLDTLSIGTIINDGNILIEKLADGNISYVTNNVDDYSIVYNTIETPTGGTYQVILPDGSKVWLNAMSKLKYPTKFTTSNRDVELEGEAYFEIAHNKNSPFFVHLTSKNKIQVLGTKFNVNTYNLSSDITSVIEGSVKVFNDNQNKILTKNQGLSIRNGVFSFTPNQNVLEDISWVDGYFCLESIRLKDLLNQVSRWYGIEVYNKDNLNNEFVLSLKRDVYLNDLIKILELTNEVKLEISNNVLYVTKAN